MLIGPDLNCQMLWPRWNDEGFPEHTALSIQPRDFFFFKEPWISRSYFIIQNKNGLILGATGLYSCNRKFIFEVLLKLGILIIMILLSVQYNSNYLVYENKFKIKNFLCKNYESLQSTFNQLERSMMAACFKRAVDSNLTY